MIVYGCECLIKVWWRIVLVIFNVKCGYKQSFSILFYYSVFQGGATGGSCAGGFGVCCYFIAECGRTYSQNLTYWAKTSTTPSPCNINVCKCQSDVCFLRLDFNSFNLYQPNTDVTAANPTLASQCVQVSLKQYIYIWVWRWNMLELKGIYIICLVF